MNTRHPFSRLFAAWSDKFRLNDEGRIADFHFESVSSAIKNIDDANTSDKDVSFTSFLDYIATVDERFYNRHWRSSYWTCSPCQFEYEYVLHLEHAAEESVFFFNKFNMNTHLPVDHRSASEKSHPPSWFYRNVSRETLENVYRKYYQDFLAFGYSADSVLEYLHEDQLKQKPPRATKIRQMMPILNEWATNQTRILKIAQYDVCNPPEPLEDDYFRNFTKQHFDQKADFDFRSIWNG